MIYELLLQKKLLTFAHFFAHFLRLKSRIRKRFAFWMYAMMFVSSSLMIQITVQDIYNASVCWGFMWVYILTSPGKESEISGQKEEIQVFCAKNSL